ncbi:MAG: HU family DNA-binding protein [Bacteroidetes bacterium]|nr:HU family DNA-binding protein [Bacteroidota bacterium]
MTFRLTWYQWILINLKKTNIMTIKIKSLARTNPRDLAAPKKYYATVVNQGDATLNSLSQQIAMMSTVSKTDVYAVLMALTEVVPLALAEGKIVRMGNLGSFRVMVNSDAVATEQEVTSNLVKQLRLAYRPSQELKTQVETFQVEKA